MAITTEQVKELRDQTGVSVMQCRKALEEAGGDMAKALIILRKKSGEMGAKKGDRTFGAGTVQAYIHSNGNVGAMITLLCETDFVSGNDEFKALARDIAMHITAQNPKFLKKEDVDETAKNTAKEVFMNEAKEQLKGKPQDIQDKILDGKLQSYFAEIVLLDQPFIKNPDITIQGLIDAGMQKFGEKIAIAKYTRFTSMDR
jgi:elongation factor Ts